MAIESSQLSISEELQQQEAIAADAVWGQIEPEYWPKSLDDSRHFPQRWVVERGLAALSEQEAEAAKAKAAALQAETEEKYHDKQAGVSRGVYSNS